MNERGRSGRQPEPTPAGNMFSVTDLEWLGAPPGWAAGPGFHGFPLPVGQGLEKVSLLGIDFLEAGIEFRHSPKRAGSLRRAPGLFEFQASDLQMRPMRDRNQIHLPCQSANGSQTSKWDGHVYFLSRSRRRRSLPRPAGSPHTLRMVSCRFSTIRDWPWCVIFAVSVLSTSWQMVSKVESPIWADPW